MTALPSRPCGGPPLPPRLSAISLPFLVSSGASHLAHLIHLPSQHPMPPSATRRVSTDD